MPDTTQWVESGGYLRPVPANLGIDLENHPGLSGLDERERLLVRTAVNNERLFREWVLADILDRRTLCAAHGQRIHRLERLRRLIVLGLTAVGATGAAVGAWMGWGK